MDDKLAYTAPDDAPVQEPINLDKTNYNPLPDPVLGDRAARADFALGDKSPGPQVLKDAFRSGQEPQIRQQAAADANVTFQQQKLDTIKTAASQGTPVTDTEVHGIMALGTTPEANPNTVFEDKFAKNIVSYGVAGDPGKNLVFQSAFDTQPDKTREGMQIAAAQVSRKHQAQDVLEQTQSARDQLPWFNTDPNARDQQDKAGDLAKTILSGGIAQYVNQRNLLNESPTNSFLPGSNKLEQIQYLYLLPHDQFKPALMAAAGPGSPLFKESPSSALDFVRAATGFSTSDAYVDNTYGIANVAGILPVGSALKGIGMLRGGKAVANVSEGVQSMESALKNANSVLKESSKAPITPGENAAKTAADVLSQSSVPESKFYIPEAAVKRPWESQPRLGEVKVQNGVPSVTTEDGAQVAVSTTPEVGHIPMTVTKDGGVKFGPTIVAKEDLETRVALADIVKSQAETHPQDVLSKMGQHEQAVTVAAQEKINDNFAQVIRSGDVEAIRRNVPSLASPQLYFNNASSLTRERADRLAQNATQASLDLSQAITDPVRVERMTQDAKDRAIEIAKTQVKEKYNRASDAILDQVEHWDSASNTYHIETKFGKKDGTLFDSSTQANHYRTFQYRLGDAATVQQEGNQFYLSHIQHADETQSGVRNSLIVSGNETPRGWWNSLATAVTGKFAPLGNSIRSSASTLAPFQMNNRVVATHSPSIMRNAIEDVSKDIQKMGNWTTGERQEMQTILEHNRDYMSPDGVRGQFYKSALEFETAFNGRFGKMPTEKQIVAYDQFTRLSDLDWTLRELDALRDKARLGIRNYRITWKGEDPNGIPQTTKSDYFNGKLVKDFDPLNTQNANVYVLPDKKFTTKFDLKDASPLSKQVTDKMKSGEYQVIQMFNPREKPLLATTGVKDDIHFVVVDKYEDKAVSFGENVPYRPGGHVIYQDQFYLKQPKIGPGTNGRLTHFGDTTIKSLATEREANQWADKYNTAREFLRTGDEAGLQAYMAQGHLPETVPDLKRMFSDGTLSVDHPIVTTHAARDTFQSNEALARQYPGLKDQFSSYNLSQTQGTDFLQDRGAQLNTIARSGTTENPIYTNVPSRLYDPYTALQKGMSQIVRSRWMADYKISAAESWVQEFGLLFDQSKLPIDKLRQNPSYWLYHADGNIDAGVMKTNPELVTAAMTSRKNILNFIGARDEVGSILEGLKNKLLSGIEGMAGPNAARIAGEKILPAISNAPEYARQAAFNAVIGMFNPAQLIQQAQGLAHVYALAPMNAIQSTTASSLMRMFRYTENPAILDHAASIASAFGWEKDHFLEAIDGWKRSGVHNIGGETALLSTTSDPQIFKSAGKAFLDKGQMFFKAGESIVRDTSWFTAYREWKAANPTAILDNRAMGEIGNRYQILSLDMTRASNSALNEGVLSMPTQFWTWNARFTEQMLGTRLTMGEKARVATMYSALYGIPATLGGITFGAVPMANYGDIRQYALANNINVHDKYYEALSEGVPTALLNSVTGHETSLQRFSPNATQLKEIIDGKKSVPEILGGASGGFVAQLAKTVWPALMYGFSAIKRDSGFPIKMNDLTNLAENMSSFNNAEKAVIGWNLGQYISKTEGMVDNHIDHYESALLALGLNPQRVNDAYTKMDYNKAREEVAKTMGKKMVEDWTLAMKGFMRGDMQTGVDYMTRVQGWSAYGNLTKAQEVDIYKQAMHGNESLVDSVEKKFRELNPNLQAIPAFKQYLENKH